MEWGSGGVVGVVGWWGGGVVGWWEWWGAIDGIIIDCQRSPLPIPFQPLILISTRLHSYYH
jgi:hypothetical protein